MRRHLSTAVGLLMIVAAVPALAAGNDEEQIVGLAKSWQDAFNAKNLDAVVALYADDCFEVGPAGITQGRDGVRKRVEGDLKMGAHDLSITVIPTLLPATHPGMPGSSPGMTKFPRFQRVRHRRA